MAKEAVLGSNLVDSLVPDVIDGIRDALHPDLGVRQYRVFAVTRTYKGARGSDNFTDSEEELVPQPLVESYTQPTTFRHRLEPCGLDTAGYVILKEISLGYTEAQIAGPTVDPALQDFFVRISDAHGQAIPDRYFTVDSPPYPDRIQGMGWELRLRSASAPGGG